MALNVGTSTLRRRHRRRRELEARLPDPPFLRAHRRAIVNLDQVELLEPTETGGYLACIRGGPKVAVSRAVSRGLRRRFGLR